MTSFSSLLSSIGDKQQAPQTQTSTKQSASGQPSQPSGNAAPSRFQLTSSNAAAGIKRKSEEPKSSPHTKAIKTESGEAANRASATASRFQLSGKARPTERPAPVAQRPITSTANISRPQAKPGVRSAAPSSNTPASASNGVTKPAPKRSGFASILEKAKLAQEASRQAMAGGIKHKPTEKLTRKERQRMREEEMAQKKAGGRKGAIGQKHGSRNGTPMGAKGAVGAPQKKPAAPLGYQGTMKKLPAEPLYKGTMRAVGSGPSKAPKPKQKGEAQDKYGGYASWSDLDDAEDDEEEEEGYDSYESDDMEGGFDDVEAEEQAALRFARREDQEALAEEERLKRDKLARKQKLMDLSKSAAGKKRY